MACRSQIRNNSIRRNSLRATHIQLRTLMNQLEGLNILRRPQNSVIVQPGIPKILVPPRQGRYMRSPQKLRQNWQITQAKTWRLRILLPRSRTRSDGSWSLSLQSLKLGALLIGTPKCDTRRLNIRSLRRRNNSHATLCGNLPSEVF